MYAVIIIVVTKQEILVISLTVFFDAASRHYNDVILTSFSVHLFTVPVNLVYVKLWLIDVWCGLEQLIFEETIDQWRGRLERMSVLKEHVSNTICELTMLILSTSVTFNVTCLTVTSLITKSC